MSDLLSPFLSIPHTWFDVSRLPLARVNSMHDEGNAAGRWYNRDSSACAAASARDALHARACSHHFFLP
jgi:hypothetical protein